MTVFPEDGDSMFLVNMGPGGEGQDRYLLPTWNLKKTLNKNGIKYAKLILNTVIDVLDIINCPVFI
jgi:hypothetical protein